MARNLYRKQTLTQLRRLARELDIPGHNRMDGRQLLRACNSLNAPTDLFA